MIKMTYMSDGNKVELNFDTVEELERFNERRMEKLEAQRMEIEERMEAERSEAYSFFAKGFLKAKSAGLSADETVDLISGVLRDLLEGNVDFGEDDGETCENEDVGGNSGYGEDPIGADGDEESGAGADDMAKLVCPSGTKCSGCGKKCGGRKSGGK